VSGNSLIEETPSEVLAGAVERIRRLADDVGRPAILVVPYIGPGLRQQCTSSGVSYLDLTGWCQIEVSSPPMVIQSVGAGQDPRPPGRRRCSSPK
jgi:hypothetical protein